uniref:Uncharacterized protein n=1 Tax=Leersia perrieri TaxID=77586 RepID=A0A0D9XCK4_9ORYZ
MSTGRGRGLGSAALPRRGSGWAASRWTYSNEGTGPFIELYTVWLVLALTGPLIVPGVLSASHDIAFLFTAWPVHFLSFAPCSKVIMRWLCWQQKEKAVALMRASMLGFAANSALALLKVIQQNYTPLLHHVLSSSLLEMSWKLKFATRAGKPFNRQFHITWFECLLDQRALYMTMCVERALLEQL